MDKISEYDSVHDITVEIEVNNYVVYECVVDVKLFRGIPCEATMKSMSRQIFDYDHSGMLVDMYNLCPSEWPNYIERAAEKKAVEEY